MRTRSRIKPARSDGVPNKRHCPIEGGMMMEVYIQCLGGEGYSAYPSGVTKTPQESSSPDGGWAVWRSCVDIDTMGLTHTSRICFLGSSFRPFFQCKIDDLWWKKNITVTIQGKERSLILCEKSLDQFVGIWSPAERAAVIDSRLSRAPKELSYYVKEKRQT